MNVEANIEGGKEEGVNRGNYAEQRFIPLTLSRTRVLFEPWLTRQSNWCPMTGRKGEDLLNVLTF